MCACVYLYGSIFWSDERCMLSKPQTSDPYGLRCISTFKFRCVFVPGAPCLSLTFMSISYFLQILFYSVGLGVLCGGGCHDIQWDIKRCNEINSEISNEI